jgi:hypothetical protein
MDTRCLFFELCIESQIPWSFQPLGLPVRAPGTEAKQEVVGTIAIDRGQALGIDPLPQLHAGGAPSLVLGAVKRQIEGRPVQIVGYVDVRSSLEEKARDAKDALGGG